MAFIETYRIEPPLSVFGCLHSHLQLFLSLCRPGPSFHLPLPLTSAFRSVCINRFVSCCTGRGQGGEYAGSVSPSLDHSLSRRGSQVVRGSSHEHQSIFRSCCSLRRLCSMRRRSSVISSPADLIVTFAFRCPAFPRSCNPYTLQTHRRPCVFKRQHYQKSC